MQKTTIYCDTCEKEIVYKSNVVTLTAEAPIVSKKTTYELCDTCWCKIENEIIWIVRRTK